MSLANKLRIQVDRLGSKLGLNPADRTNVEALPGPAEPNPFENLRVVNRFALD